VRVVRGREGADRASPAPARSGSRICVLRGSLLLSQRATKGKKKMANAESDRRQPRVVGRKRWTEGPQLSCCWPTTRQSQLREPSDRPPAPPKRGARLEFGPDRRKEALGPRGMRALTHGQSAGIEGVREEQRRQATITTTTTININLKSSTPRAAHRGAPAQSIAYASDRPGQATR